MGFMVIGVPAHDAAYPCRLSSYGYLVRAPRHPLLPMYIRIAMRMHMDTATTAGTCRTPPRRSVTLQSGQVLAELGRLRRVAKVQIK